MPKSENTLFPVFLKLENLNLLLVGGGRVGLEKLQAIISNNPAANVKIVAEKVLPELKSLAKRHDIELSERRFETTDLNGQNIVILATNNIELDANIKSLAKTNSAIVNVADKPDLCDFYLGSIVKKGDLKIGISTNGKSPTIAKRIKELLQVAIPDEMHDLLGNMKKIRNELSGNFHKKVKTLNELTGNWNQNTTTPSIKNKSELL